jgi:hypothetical protein
MGFQRVLRTFWRGSRGQRPPGRRRPPGLLASPQAKRPCRAGKIYRRQKDPLPPARPSDPTAQRLGSGDPEGRNKPWSAGACLSGRPGVASLRAAVLGERRCAVSPNTRPRRGGDDPSLSLASRFSGETSGLGQVLWLFEGETRSPKGLRRPRGRCPLDPHQKVQSTLWNPIVASGRLLSRTWVSGVNALAWLFLIAGRQGPPPWPWPPGHHATS